MSLELVEKLGDALAVRRLRNSCREHLTNFQAHIGWVQQLRWYLGYYRQARRSGSYRLYLWRDEHDLIVGYGALSLRDNQLLITECVASEHRGRGHGKSILKNLILLASKENRDLVAEIWATNEPSLTLHEEAGFKLSCTVRKQGKELRTYVLQTQVAHPQTN